MFRSLRGALLGWKLAKSLNRILIHVQEKISEKYFSQSE